LTGSLLQEIPFIRNKINEMPKEMTIMDLIVILDGSASVGANNFKIMQDFTLHIIDKMNINEDNIRLCIIQFAEKAKLEINFSNQQNLILKFPSLYPERKGRNYKHCHIA